MIIDTRKVFYKAPSRIIDTSKNVKNADSLLKEKSDQISLNENDYIEINGAGYILLDFGIECSGGIRILTYYNDDVDETYNIRVRFGESVSEANSELSDGSTNNHAIRDFTASLTALSDIVLGDTGFRFVRIDFLENKSVKIKNIYVKDHFHGHKRINTISTKDKLINQIFETSVHTIDLCINNYIWDGVKRDRLVWIGDLAIEIHAILNLYGFIPEIEKSINIIEETYDPNKYMSGFPSYSLWYLYVINDVYSFTKDEEFLKRHKAYSNKVLKMLINKIDENGNIIFDDNPTDLTYFIDWPSVDFPMEEKISANKDLMIYIFRLLSSSIMKENKDLKSALTKLEKEPTKIANHKQFLAFHYLVRHDKESYNKLIEDGAKGMSTFMSYFILKAISDVSFAKATKIMKDYYGAMLDLGATTFFEDFTYGSNNKYGRIDELPKKGEIDFHRTYGKHCYKSYRHSLCHGWSVGPISFLLENR